MNANVLMFQTPDDGEVEFVDGQPTVSGGLDTMAYLCLFGGNIGDDGRESNPRNWWGNLSENLPERQYRSETQTLLFELAAVPANLLRLRDAATRDLSAMIDAGIVSGVSVDVTMPGLNRVAFSIQLTGEEGTTELQFVENWKASA